jgi:C1A family cysteine protease
MFFNKLFVALAFAGVACNASLTRFEQWLSDFKIHVHDNNHRERMFASWVSNDKFIDEVNSMNKTYTLGHNHFSGMNSEEFREYLKLSGLNFEDRSFGRKMDISKLKRIIAEVKCLEGCIKAFDASHKLQTVGCVSDCLSDDNVLALADVPTSVNWVQNGGVTPVKNQGQCGSCWSFSTTGALEGAYFNKYGVLDSFSEQQLVDCDNRKNGGKDMGCNGGLMDNAFTWIGKNGGLCSESAYPYTSGTTKTAGTCVNTCSVNTNSKIVSFVDVAPKSDSAMMAAISQQPVSIAIEADQKEFQLYKSGVFTGDCGTNLDHGVLVVGYGTESGGDFYLVKNSWGTTWGDNGYIKLGRGSQYNKGAGQCGMLMQGSYPEL